MKNIKRILIYIFIITISILSCILIFNCFRGNDIDNYNYEIPRIYIDGNIEKMETKEDIRQVNITYKSKDLNFDSYATLKIQGSSSTNYDKKNYTINLFSDKDYENKKSIDVGFGSKQNKYVLKANWVDKTHSRNIVSSRLISEINNKYNLFTNTPNNGMIDGFPVELYENNKFLGLYTLNIPKDSWLFNMDENNENHILFDSSGWSDTNLFKDTATRGDISWEVEVGLDTDDSFNKLNRVINFVNTSTDEEFKRDFSNYLDLNSSIIYLIILELAQLEDNVANNLLLVTYNGNYWYPVLYDLDASWGVNCDGTHKMEYYINTHSEDNKLFERLLKNFPKEIKEMYFELRKDILTKEHIIDLFNDFYNSIPEETIKKENKRWNNIPGFDIKQIDEFLNVRIPMLDNIMKNR